ncbi:SH3 domain-containing protein [Phenylobacterium sp. CCH12-B4]|uniref:SH3 domain-containing protein n=2 Tax=unclassified Phenylobacterium TaxID=2640670 RepID=UPI000AE0E6CE|nr:SH3 domain-containing protein [Phenylobacterium sp. CCH12-B4]
METLRNARRLRMAVSAVALLSLTVQPVMAQGKGGKDAVLNACAAERAPLQKLDKEYDDLKKSKMSAAIGEGLKTGAMVLAKGVTSGGFGRGGGGFGGGLGGMGSLMGAVGGMAMQSAAQQQAGGGQAASTGASLMFGQDMLTGAMGLNVPGVSGYGGFGGSGGDNMKAYAALAVLVAIVATADAYAKLKEQEAGGDLKKASFNIDQDAGRQLTVSRSIADSGAALVECRSAQLTDINNRLATASNDKDRKAIRRERTELTSALKKDIDLTGGVVDQHTNMAKTFTQGRAMTDGTSEAEVLGSQAPAYAAAPAVTKLSMPKGSGAGASGEASSAPPAAAPPELVTVKAAVVRSAPVASAAPVKSLPVGSALQARIAAADGGWWEVEVGGQTGYVRASEVGPPGSAPVQTAARGGARGKGAAARPAPPPPAPVGPSNIRAYNQSVIAARDNGKGRLSTLMTDIQTAERRESVLYAWLSNLGLG